MVDQATVTPPEQNTESKPRVMAQTTGELLLDMLTLAELQAKLLVLDVKQARQVMMPMAIWFVAGTVLLASCLPILLVTIALLLAEITSLSLAQAFLVSLLLGAGVGSGCLLWARRCLHHHSPTFQRSQSEWRANASWCKNVLNRVCKRL